MSDREHVAALAARHAALEQELAAKVRARDAAARALDDAHARTRLPVLDQLQVATRCGADWNAMTGDDRVRCCGDCKQNVYNFSAMTRAEAGAAAAVRLDARTRSPALIGAAHPSTSWVGSSGHACRG